MVGPAGVCVLYICLVRVNLWMILATIAVCIHMFFSMAYHIGCARRTFRNENEGGIYLQADQTFIHVVGAIFALGTSGSYLYFLQVRSIQLQHGLGLFKIAADVILTCMRLV